MFSRSRGHILVRRANLSLTVAAVDRFFRRWDYRRLDDIPHGYPGDRHQELRELYAIVAGEWCVLAVEDLAELFQLAYQIHTVEPAVPVLASRAYRGGDWQLKAYADRDLLFKVGDDPDHELAWVGRPLDADGLPDAVRRLGGGPPLDTFLHSVVAHRRPDPLDLTRGLGLPSLALGFPDLGPADGWTYAAWVHVDSPLLRR